jgi:uncharacterized phage infection (PIP) family protein YhgE
MRHPSVQHLVDLLKVNENLPEGLKTISQRFTNLRDDLLNDVKEDTPEVAAGLRKILEAKDCFVRAAHLARTQIGEMVQDATHDKDSTPVKPADELPPSDGELPTDPPAGNPPVSQGE